MEQQLKFNILTGVIGSEKIDQLKNKINSIPESSGKIQQFSGVVMDMAGQFAPAAAAAFAAFETIKQAASSAMNTLISGEKVNAINSQFNTLARSVGISGEAMSDALIKATDGLIDDEDALRIATQGIVALGSEASRLPEIMDLARGASRTLGTDLKSTFGDLTQFAEFGNQKVLRQYGLVLDVDGAYKKAAQSIGLSADQLNEAQKQQVRLNLLIDQASEKFKETAESVTPFADAIDRISVSWSNKEEELSSGLASLVKRIMGGGSDHLKKQLTETEVLNQKIQDTAMSFKGKFGAADSIIVATAAQKAEIAKKRNEEWKKEVDLINKFSMAQFEQINIEKISIDSYAMSSSEIEKNKMQLKLRSDAQKESIKLSSEAKQKLFEVTEEVIRQKMELIDHADAMKSSWGVGAIRAITKYTDSVRDMAAQSEQAFSNAISNMENDLLNFIKTGEDNFSRFANAVIDDIIRIQLRQATLGIYTGIKDFISAGVSAGGSSAVSSAAAGGRSVIPAISGTNKSGLSENSQAGTNVSINIVVNSDGSSDVNSTASSMLNTAQGIKALVLNTLVEQRKSGGILGR